MGIVATTEPAIKCCLGTSESFNETIPRDKVNRFKSSKNMNENKKTISQQTKIIVHQ